MKAPIRKCNRLIELQHKAGYNGIDYLSDACSSLPRVDLMEMLDLMEIEIVNRDLLLKVQDETILKSRAIEKEIFDERLETARTTHKHIQANMVVEARVTIDKALVELQRRFGRRLP